MPQKLTVVTQNGSIDIHEVCKLSFLLLLSALCIVAALAINETIQKILGTYIKRDCIFGYVLYSFISVALIISVAYMACKCYPDLFDHINLTPHSRYY